MTKQTSSLYCRKCGDENELLNSLNGCLNCLKNGIKHPVEIKYNLAHISKNFFDLSLIYQEGGEIFGLLPAVCLVV